MSIKGLRSPDISTLEDRPAVSFADSVIADYMVDASPQSPASDEVLTAIEDYVASGSTKLGLEILGQRLAFLKGRAIAELYQIENENKGDVS